MCEDVGSKQFGKTAYRSDPIHSFLSGNFVLAICKWAKPF